MPAFGNRLLLKSNADGVGGGGSVLGANLNLVGSAMPLVVVVDAVSHVANNAITCRGLCALAVALAIISEIHFLHAPFAIILCAGEGIIQRASWEC